MEKPVIIFGAKGLAKATLDIFNSNNIVVYGFLDDDDKIYHQEINTITVLGATDNHDYTKLIGEKCDAFIATEDIYLRKNLVKYLTQSRKIMPINAIHKSTIISKSFNIGHGNFVNAGAILSNDSKMGNHNVLHSKTIIEQEVEIGHFVQIGAGSIINTNVAIEDDVFIGSGATIVAGLTIENGAKIGAGSVVVNNIKKNQVVFGNPAVEVKR